MTKSFTYWYLVEKREKKKKKKKEKEIEKQNNKHKKQNQASYFVQIARKCSGWMINKSTTITFIKHIRAVYLEVLGAVVVVNIILN